MLSQSRFVLKIVNQASLDACVPREISVPTELALGHLRCCVTDMPPQPNSPSGRCLETRLSVNPKAYRLVHKVSTVGPSCGTPEDVHAEAHMKCVSIIIPNQDGAQPVDCTEPLVSSFDK